MIRKLLIGGFLLVLLLAAAVGLLLVLFVQDTSRVESFLSSTLQREVVIGELNIEGVGSDLSLLLRDASIANPAWADEPELVRVTELSLRVQLASLWREGPVVVEMLELEGAEANLLAITGQDPSWQFDLNGGETHGSPRGWDKVEAPVVFQQARITNSQLLFRTPEAELRATMNGQLVGGSGIKLQVQGEVKGSPTSLRVTLSRSDGAFRLGVTGDDLSASLAPWVQGGIPADAYTLSTQVEATANELTLEQIKLVVGASDLSGSVKFAWGEPAQLNAVLVSEHMDLAFLFPEKREEANTQTGNDSKGNQPLTRKQLEDRVIPATPLDVGWLQTINGDIRLLLKDVILRERDRAHVEVELEIAKAVLVTRKLQWRGAYSSGEARIELRDLSPGAGLNILVDTERLPFFWVVTGNPEDGTKANYHIALKGEGTTAANLAASLNGSVAFKGSGGKMDNRGLELFLGDFFEELFATIDPEGNNDPYTNMVCHAGAVSLKNGLVELAPGVVLRTDKLDIALGGTVNLNDESVDVLFNTRSRTGVGLSASKAVTPYVKLGGNFAHPRMGVNAKGVVVSGGMALATGGVSIVAEGMWDRWVGTSGNPCEALFENANQQGPNIKKILGRP